MHDYTKEVHWETESWYMVCYLACDKRMVDRADIVLVVQDGIPESGTIMLCSMQKKRKNVFCYSLGARSKYYMNAIYNAEHDKDFDGKELGELELKLRKYKDGLTVRA